jgi:hypothetical protein
MDDARFIYLIRRFHSNQRKIYHVIRELGKCMNGHMDGWMDEKLGTNSSSRKSKRM